MKCSICNHEGADVLGCEGKMEHIRPQRCMKNHGDDIAELKRRVEALEGVRPIRPEPVERKCVGCGATYSTASLVLVRGRLACADTLSCLKRQLSATVARAEKAERQLRESSELLMAAMHAETIAKSELRKIVEAGRKWWDQMVGVTNNDIRLYEALRPHMQQEGG